MLTGLSFDLLRCSVLVQVAAPKMRIRTGASSKVFRALCVLAVLLCLASAVVADSPSSSSSQSGGSAWSWWSIPGSQTSVSSAPVQANSVIGRNAYAVVASRSGEVLLIGGYGNSPHTPDPVVFSTSDAGASWQVRSSAVPFVARSYAVAAFDSAERVFVAGGIIATDPANPSVLRSARDVWSSADFGATWAPVVANCPWYVDTISGQGAIFFDAKDNLLVFAGTQNLAYDKQLWIAYKIQSYAYWRLVALNAPTIAPWNGYLTSRVGFATYFSQNNNVLTVAMGFNNYNQALMSQVLQADLAPVIAFNLSAANWTGFVVTSAQFNPGMTTYSLLADPLASASASPKSQPSLLLWAPDNGPHDVNEKAAYPVMWRMGADPTQWEQLNNSASCYTQFPFPNSESFCQYHDDAKRAHAADNVSLNDAHCFQCRSMAHAYLCLSVASCCVCAVTSPLSLPGSRVLVMPSMIPTSYQPYVMLQLNSTSATDSAAESLGLTRVDWCPPPDHVSTGLPVGLIAGIIAGAVVGLIAIFAILRCMCIRKQGGAVNSAYGAL